MILGQVMYGAGLSKTVYLLAMLIPNVEQQKAEYGQTPADRQGHHVRHLCCPGVLVLGQQR